MEKPTSQSSISTVLRFRSLPPPQPLPRTVHCPQRNLKFFGSANPVRKSQVAIGMGGCQSRVDDGVRRKETRAKASNSVRKSGDVVEAVDVESDQSIGLRNEDLIVEEHKRLVEGRDGDLVVLDGPSSDVQLQELQDSKAVDSPLGLSSAVLDLSVLAQKTSDEGKMAGVVLVNDAVERLPVHKELNESLQQWDLKLSSLDSDVGLAEQKISALKLKDRVEEVKEVYYFAFLDCCLFVLLWF